MARFSWCEGYDGEWEYEVEVGDGAVRWRLQLDPQWSDTPRDEVQSMADFLARGAPSGFSRRMDDEIRREVRARLGGGGPEPSPPAPTMGARPCVCAHPPEDHDATGACRHAASPWGSCRCVG